MVSVSHTRRGSGPVGRTPVRSAGDPLVAQSGRQSRVSLRCVTACGRAASEPKRSTLFFS